MTPMLYDINKSYEDNYTDGPPLHYASTEIPKRTITKKYPVLGTEVNIPFGIPSGPLLNSEYIKAAFNLGFDVCTYKTVRAGSFPCHPYPNVRFLDISTDLHPDKTPRLTVNEETPSSFEKINITNSFGVPSKDPSIWQEDVKKALTYQGEGQLLILSFMGTVREGQSRQDFIDDNVQAAKLSFETGVKALEINLSCPNIGNEGLICYDIQMSEDVLKAVRNAIGNTPLSVKIGYYKDDSQLEKMAKIINEYGNAVCAINTLQVEVVDKNGNQALPGKNRLRSGVCGSGIKWAGIEMVQKFKQIAEKNSFSYEIKGVGGVMTAQDYLDYRNAGADCVQSATGAMWNPRLAYEVYQAETTR